MRRYCAMLAVILLGCCHAGGAAPAAATAAEAVHVGDGTYLLSRHTPATTADLEMPIFKPSTVGKSFAYLVRDRKQRDLLHYARLDLTTTQPPANLLRFYRVALGAQAITQTEKTSGEITVAAGVKDDVRLVTISPRATSCQVRLERVKRFTIPPRAYSAREQQVIHILAQVAHTYQHAEHVSYRVEQHNEDQSASPPQQVQHWSIDYHRPRQQLQISVSDGTKPLLAITTETDHLLVTVPGRKTEQRPFGKKITANLLPELQDDPVARLMLGDTLITEHVDELTLEAVAGVPAVQQAKITLTFPDNNMTLTLVIDLRQHTILRSEMHVTEEKEKQQFLRIYTDLHLDLPASVPKP